MSPLLFRAIESNGIDHAEMVVSNLGNGGICFGNRSENFYHGGVAHPRSSMCLGNADRPKTTAGKLVQLEFGKNPFPVSFGCAQRKFLSEVPGDRQSFLIGCYPVSIRAARL